MAEGVMYRHGVGEREEHSLLFIINYYASLLLYFKCQSWMALVAGIIQLRSPCRICKAIFIYVLIKIRGTIKCLNFRRVVNVVIGKYDL